MGLSIEEQREKIREQKRLKIHADKEARIQQSKQAREDFENREDIIEFKRHLIFDLAGIYFLKHHGRIVYIGESECVLSRISEHIKDGVKEFDTFTFSVFGGTKFARKDKEATLIKRFQPKYNLTHNRRNSRRKKVTLVLNK